MEFGMWTAKLAVPEGRQSNFELVALRAMKNYSIKIIIQYLFPLVMGTSSLRSVIIFYFQCSIALLTMHLGEACTVG